jgi:hypothetical protein
MKTWQEIKDERDHACAVARNAANCLGSLYNILGNIEENGAAKSAAQRDQCLEVLESELSTVNRDKREVVAAINARIAEMSNAEVSRERGG